jgi:hypothetical protein
LLYKDDGHLTVLAVDVTEAYTSWQRQWQMAGDTQSYDGLPASLLANLEHAAISVARLDTALTRHPLAAAWAYRARLEAVRRHAAVDGTAIDPWDLAAVTAGVRLRLDRTPFLGERIAIFTAARQALALYRWFTTPDHGQQTEIANASDHLDHVALGHAPLLGAALAAHAWLEEGGARPPLRAALAHYWVRHGVTALPSPLLSGAAALDAGVPWTRSLWIAHFLEALAIEATDGLALLRTVERHWLRAREAVAGRRRDSHAAAAIDIMAAAPLVSATMLGHTLGIARKNAQRLLDGFVRVGIASEVSRRHKRRLYGLPHLLPLRDAAAVPRRPIVGHGHRRPGAARPISPAAEPLSPRVPFPPVVRPTAPEFDFSDLDRLIDLTDRAMRRVDRVLAERRGSPDPAMDGHDGN